MRKDSNQFLRWRMNCKWYSSSSMLLGSMEPRFRDNIKMIGLIRTKCNLFWAWGILRNYKSQALFNLMVNHKLTEMGHFRRAITDKFLKCKAWVIALWNLWIRLSRSIRMAARTNLLAFWVIISSHSTSRAQSLNKLWSSSRDH